MADLFALTEAQHGVFTRRQALAAGYSPRAVSHHLTSGDWRCVQPRVYRRAGTPLSWHARVLAAMLSGPPRMVASHGTAAALLGIERVARRDVIEVCVPGRAKTLLHDVVVHRTLRLEPCDVAAVAGLPVTTGARTVIDLAALLPRQDVAALVDDAICSKTVNRSWLHRRAAALRPGRRNVAYLMTLTGDGADGTFRSWLERHAAGVFGRGGLPAPQWNAPLRREGRLLGIVDALGPLRVSWSSSTA